MVLSFWYIYLFQGVTDPMLYIGMLFSMFAWHVEDHYLYRQVILSTFSLMFQLFSFCTFSLLLFLSALTIITVGLPKLGMEFLVMKLFSLRILSGIAFIMRKSYQKMGSMELLIFFKREQLWFLQRFCYNMVSRFTRLCKCQESLSLPSLEHTIQDLVMVRSW